ncbi:MAG: hypothetical protein GY845_08710 [Planctomycetes bacterium]|nr:hypothetical protein [Planctomycetota bacterium]
MDKKNRPRNMSVTIVIRGGSVNEAITVSGKKLCKRTDVHYNQVFKVMHFDWSQNPPGSTQTNKQEEFINNDEFVRAILNSNPDVLAEANKKGFLWAVNKDFFLNPGSLSDNLGAGGKPSWGYILAILNAEALCSKIRKLMQAARDYELSKIMATKGNKLQEIGRVPISITISTVGAMGTGFLYWLINEGLPICAQQTAIKTKVTLHLLLRGNFDTQNSEKARLNQYITMKHPQVLASGKYFHPLTGCISPITFTNCFLYSNVNDHGNFTSLPQLLYHQAHNEFFLWATPAGGLMRERACDIEDIQYDEYGDSLCGQTLSVAMVTRDSKRVIQFCTLKTVNLFCEQLITHQQSQQHIDEAIALARNEKVIETAEDNLLTSDLIHPAEMGSENIIHQARESLLDHLEGSWGFQSVLQLDECIADTLNNDIPSLYDPAMKMQAQLRLEVICKTIARTIQQKLRTPQGLTLSLLLLSVLRQIAQDSQQALREKNAQIQDYLLPHQMVIADASEQIQELQQRNVFARWFSFFLIRRIRSALQQSGMAAIAHQLELSCCRIADQDVLTPLIEFLDKKIGWLASTQQKIKNLAQSCRIQVSRLAAEDTTFQNPNGFELTTPEYLDQYFTQYINHHNGSEAFCEELHGNFLKAYNSMDIFLETPQAELQEILQKLFKPIFESVVRSTTVWDEFEKTFPDSHTRQEMLTQLICHSEGRVPSEDSVYHKVTWVKTANVPHPSCVEPIRRLLESLDKKSGKWEITSHSDIDSFVIGQLRGSISLSPFIRKLNIPDNEIGWKALLEQAVDPVSALIVPPNPNSRQFKRVLVKAIVSNLLTIKEGLFYLQQINDEPLSLGQDYNSVKNILVKKWPEVVFIESVYARDLIVDEKQTLEKLGTLHGSDDSRLSLVGQKNIEECMCQTQIMLPRLRRMRTAAMQEEKL